MGAMAKGPQAGARYTLRSSRTARTVSLDVEPTAAESLVRMARRLNNDLHLDAVLTAVCEETAHALCVPATTVTLYDEANDCFRAARTYGTPLASQALQTVASATMRRGSSMIGVLFATKRGMAETFAPEEIALLEALADLAAHAITNARLFQQLERSAVELAAAYDTTLAGWSRALDLRDRETEGHSRRVAQHAVRLAREAGISEDQLIHIHRGAELHDIGKIGVPDTVLLKPGPLTDDEWNSMRRHPEFAHEMLAPIAYLRPALDIPYCHHERWDGSGYPRRLAGAEIPLAARVFSVVDVWDSLRHDRPYRRAWTEQQVRAHMAASAGSHFDPEIVEVFLELEW